MFVFLVLWFKLQVSELFYINAFVSSIREVTDGPAVGVAYVHILHCCYIY